MVERRPLSAANEPCWRPNKVPTPLIGFLFFLKLDMRTVMAGKGYLRQTVKEEAMVEYREMTALREKLLQRRDDILKLLKSIRASWGELQEPAQEFEENASKRTIAGGLEQIDYRTIEELRNIDAALEKLEKDQYGQCEICERAIGHKRLEALPWAKHCISCAQQAESADNGVEDGEEEADRMPLPLSDSQLVDNIWDALDTEESLKTDGLEIASTDGVVELTGFMPDRRQHQIVLEIIEESAGISEIIDHIEVIDERWEGDEDEDEDEDMDQDEPGSEID
jgi:DnaK suppressor protein